jgi:hypothetical protein
VIPASEIRDPEVRALAERASAYVDRFRWCDEVTGCALGFAIAGVLGVFRVELRPAGAGVDPAVWVVVGDVPPAYLAYEAGDTWQDALRMYVDEMQAWADAVRAGESTEDLIPVDAAPTAPTALNADMLASRLAFVRERLLDAPADSFESDV